MGGEQSDGEKKLRTAHRALLTFPSCGILLPIGMSIRPTHHKGFAPQPAPRMYRTIAYTFLALTVLVVIGVLWLSSVQARITVNVKQETTNIDTVVDVAQAPQPGQLHGAVVEGVYDQVKQFSVDDTSSSTVPNVGIVTGVVKITNNYSQPQTLVEKTRLLTSDNRLYRITKTITINPKETINVLAVSDKPGATYILAPGTRMTIPGLWIDLQKWIYADSVSGFSASGATASAKVVTAAQLSNAYASLEDAAFTQAKQTLQAEAGAQSDWQVLYEKKVVQQNSTVLAGETGDHFTASLKLDVTAVYYPQSDIRALVRDKLKDKLPDGRALVNFDPSQATYSIDQADPKAETARVHIVADASASLTAQSPELAKSNFLGLSESEASAKILSIDGVQNVNIQISPSWIHSVPTNATHVQVNVQ